MSGTTIDPRVTRTREAVLDAAREILVEDGWEDVTLGKVALRSGLARATLYRHWPNRLDLLEDLIREEGRLTHTVPTGDLRADLVAELEAFRSAVTGSGLGHALIAIAHRARTDAAFAELNGTMRAEGVSVLMMILADAQGRGELRTDLRSATATATLVGPVLYGFLFDDETRDPDLITDIVDQFIAANS